MTSGTTYRLVRAARAGAGRPCSTSDQQRVVDHPGGPLLVLAGPGTGKTTTLVEAIVDRIERRGAAPDPGAGADLLAARPPSSSATGSPPGSGGRPGRRSGSTFHSFAYGLIRRYAPRRALRARPLRLLSRARAGRRAARAAAATTRSRSAGPTQLDRALGTRGFAREVQTVLVPGPREGPRRRRRCVALGERRAGCRSSSPPGCSSSSTSTTSTTSRATDYADLIRRAVDRGDGPPRRAARAVPRTSSSTSTRTPTPARSRCSARSPATAATWSWSATRTSRSTGSAAPRCAASSTSRPTSRAPTARPADVVALRTTRRFGPRLLVGDPAGRRPDRRCPARIDAEAREAFLAPAGRGRTARRRAGSRCRTFDTERAEAEHLADLLRRAHLEDGVAVGRDGRAGALRSGQHPAAAPRARRGRRPGRGGQRRAAAGPDPAVLPLLDALRAVVNLDNDDRDHVDYVDHAPRRGAAARAARRPRRGRRTPPRAAAARPREGRRPTPSAGCRSPPASWSAARCSRDGYLDGLDGPEAAARPRRCTRCVRSTRRASSPTAAPPRTLLWTLWSGTDWPGRLRRSVELGGGARPSGAPRPRLDRARSSTSPPAAEEHARPRRRPRLPGDRWSPSRSPPTRWPSGASAAPPYAC